MGGDAAVNVPAHRLSGGQKACVKFAALSLYPAHILLLDEPTNHLDAEARRALAQGLADFKGGVVVVSHDDNLIYELIECNLSTAELLVCQGGTVRREREFGTQRLRNLKKKVREAEASKFAQAPPRKRNLVRPPKVQVVQSKENKSKGFEPSTPPGFLRVSGRVKTLPLVSEQSPQDHSTELARCKVSDDETTQELEQSCQKPSAESRRVKVLLKKLREINVLKTRDCALLDSAALQKISHERDFEEELYKLQNGFQVPVEELSSDHVENASLHTSVDIVEQAREFPASQSAVDIMHEQKEESQSAVEIMRQQKEELSVSNDVPDSWMDLAENEELVVSTCISVEDIASAELDADHPCAGKSGHSRQRKHLVNLNKAVVKWQKSVERGTLARETMLERIRASPAAAHLQAVHKDGFEDEKFVQDVLSRAGVIENSLMGKASLGGA